jgi:hypothetical protein
MLNNNNPKNTTNQIPSLLITEHHLRQIISHEDSHNQNFRHLDVENTKLHSPSNNAVTPSNSQQKTTKLSKFQNEQKKTLLAPGYYNLNFSNRPPYSGPYFFSISCQ